jgi:hypothetical protein
MRARPAAAVDCDGTREKEQPEQGEEEEEEEEEEVYTQQDTQRKEVLKEAGLNMYRILLAV